jgi:hypothetical protein
MLLGNGVATNQTIKSMELSTTREVTGCEATR